MEDWKRNIIGELVNKIDCCDCPLNIEAGGECAGGNYEQCEVVWKDFFNESDDDEKEESEETKNEVTDAEKKNFMDFIEDLIIHDIVCGSSPKPPVNVITVNVGEMTVKGEPRCVAEFFGLVGESFAP